MALPKVTGAPNFFAKPDAKLAELAVEPAVPAVQDLQEQLRAPLGELAQADVPPLEEIAGRAVPTPTGEVTTAMATPGMGAQLETEELFKPMTLDELSPERDLQEIADEATQRLQRIDEAANKQTVIKREALSSRESKVPKGQDRVIKKSDISEINSRANNLIDDLANPEQTVMNNISAGQLASTVLGQVEPTRAAMALDLAMIQEVAEINKMGLNNQDFEQMSKDSFDIEKDYFNQINTSDLENATPVKEGDKFAPVGAIKTRLLPNQEDSIDTDQYQFINNTAVRMVNRAKEMLGIDLPSTDVDTKNEAELGEYLIQRAINNGTMGIYSFLDAASGKKYYYPQLLKGNENLINVSNNLNALMNPAGELVRLGSLTPTSYKGELTAGFNLSKKKNTVIKPDGQEVSLSEITLSLLGGVAREVDPEILAIVNFMVNEQGDMEYLKLDNKNLSDTRLKAYEQVKAKLLSQGMDNNRAEQIAVAKSELEVDRSYKAALTKALNELQMMQRSVDRKDENGRQMFRYAEWGISQINNRIQEVSRDMQSDSKAIIRAIDNFGEKARLVKKNIDQTDDVVLAERLKKIIKINDDQTRNGLNALEMFSNLPMSVQQEMSTKAIWAATFIKLSETPPPYEYTKTSGELPANTKRMTPVDLISYYAKHKKEIHKKLGEYGAEVEQWIKTGPPKPEQRNAWQKKTLERGELGYHVTNLLDIYRYNKAPEGTNLTLKGMYEIDANNSNVAIQGLKTGNLAAIGTLGFIVDPENPDAWYDTMQNPDSFYRILGNNLSSIVEKTFNDEDKITALDNFYKAVIESGKEKDLTRDSVVAGFYGLHPKVNVGSIRKVLRMFDSIAQEELVNKGPYNNTQEAMQDLLDVAGNNFNEVLGSISVSRTIKQIGSIIALSGDFDPQITTDIGDIIKSQVGELLPEYMQDMAYEATTGGRLMARPAIAGYLDSEGYDVPYLRNQSRIDERSERVTLDAEGKLKDIHKEHGARFMDGLAAIITHSQDAALQKISIAAQNAARFNSENGVKVPLPNVSIHDANKLNAVSFINDWISYNMVAMPSLAKQEDSFTKVKQIADDVISNLQKKAKERVKSGEPINVGTKSSKHRALFNIFDYYLDISKDPTPESYRLFNGDAKYNKKEKKRQRIMKEILPLAAANGWVSKDPRSKSFRDFEKEGNDPIAYRQNAAVTPQQFLKLVEAAMMLQGFLDMDGRISNAPINYTMSQWSKNRKALIEKLDKGLYTSNGKN